MNTPVNTPKNKVLPEINRLSRSSSNSNLPKLNKIRRNLVFDFENADYPNNNCLDNNNDSNDLVNTPRIQNSIQGFDQNLNQNPNQDQINAPVKHIPFPKLDLKKLNSVKTRLFDEYIDNDDDEYLDDLNNTFGYVTPIKTAQPIPYVPKAPTKPRNSRYNVSMDLVLESFSDNDNDDEIVKNVNRRLIYV